MRKWPLAITVITAAALPAAHFFARGKQDFRVSTAPASWLLAPGKHLPIASSQLPTAEESEAIALVESLKPSLFAPGSGFAERDSRLQEAMASWKKSEFFVLSALCNRADADLASKRVAIYLLRLSGQAGIPALASIASSPIPGQVPEGAARAELALRLEALDALDLLSEQHSEASQSFSLILELQDNPQLRFFAQVARLGIEQHKPGKLHRWMEATIKNGKADG